MTIFRGALLLSLLFAHSAQARVFSLKDSGLGVLLRGTGGMSGVADDPYANSSGIDTSTDDESKYQYGGELGVVFGVSESFNLRMGAEIMKHHPVQGHGKNPAGQDRFEYESSTFVFNPNVAAEIFFKFGQKTRYFGEVGVGYAMVDVENRYTMTNTGTSELNGVTDFNEKMSGRGMSYMVGAGLETTMLDNVALSVEGGYRYIKITELKYTGDVNNIVAAPGTARKDETALNHDGSKRGLDLGGLFIGASLRFYLHFL